MATMLHEEDLLPLNVLEGHAAFSSANCRQKGMALHEAYIGADPFPHVVIPSMLSVDIVRQIAAEFPQYEPGRFSDPQSRLKTGYQLEKITSPHINAVINALNSAAFLDFLRALTGIKGLVPDPYQLGGGLHETRRGGHLSIHADFNMHPLLKMKQRLNLILFLTEHWDASYGGALELWSKDMQRCEVSVLPVLGTAVIFNTDADSFHGHPDPLTCPDSVTRRSLALYYYTAFEGNTAAQVSRTTNFQVRPGSDDKPDYRTRLREFTRDICPPLIYRALSRSPES